jgi:hypothetical protein
MVVEPDEHSPVIHITPRHAGCLSWFPLYRLDAINGKTLLNEAMSEQIEPKTDILWLRIIWDHLGEAPTEQVSHLADQEPAEPAFSSGLIPDYPHNQGQPHGRSNKRKATAKVHYGEKNKKNDNCGNREAENDLGSRFGNPHFLVRRHSTHADSIAGLS